MKNESLIKPTSGYLMLTLVLILLVLVIIGFVMEAILFAPILLAITIFLVTGFFVVQPNQSVILVLFGSYSGSVKENGFFWANPFFTKKKVSLRARNFNCEPIKVNDKVGNPIMIGLVLVWRVKETFKAAFEVDNYEHFVLIQTEAALRKLAGIYPYDNFEIEEATVTLRAGTDEVNEQLEKELKERLDIAGIEVIEARINQLAYSSEIAGAMLKRQQASAIIAAREKIVEGAVGMVEMALKQLAKREMVNLDEERKAAMVSNLMVVLCSEESARPIINAGTLNH
jgi:regulator of protease activity HflC (stomatin/prohibitin superfamily)